MEEIKIYHSVWKYLPTILILLVFTIIFVYAITQGKDTPLWKSHNQPQAAVRLAQRASETKAGATAIVETIREDIAKERVLPKSLYLPHLIFARILVR